MIALSQSQQWWAELDGAKFDWIDAKVDIPPERVQSQELVALVGDLLILPALLLVSFGKKRREHTPRVME